MLSSKPSHPVAAGTSQVASRSSGKQGERRVRLLLLAGLVISLAVYWFVIGAPRWRARRLAQMNTADLTRACSQHDLAACTLLGNRLIRARQAERAVAPLKECLNAIQAGSVHASTAEKAQVLGVLGLALALSNQVPESASYFRPAIYQDFNCAPAHLAFAFWLNSNNAYAIALKELDTTLTLDPDNDLAWFLRAHIYNNNKEPEKARDAAQKAIALNPSFPNSWQELGDAFGYSGRYEECLPYYQQELKLDPDSPTAQADVARALALAAKDEAQYQEAVQRITDVLNRNIVEAGPGYTLLGQLHLRFGRYKEARAALEKSLKLDDTVPEVYYSLSQALRLTGDIKGAEKATAQYKEMELNFREARTLQKQLSEHPDDPDLHLALAKKWEHYKSWSNALREYQATLTLRPQDRVARARAAALARYSSQIREPVAKNFAMARLLNANAAIILSPNQGRAPALMAPSAAQP